MINTPTRSTLNSDTIIDLVFSNFKFDTKVLKTPKISDHNIIEIKIKNKTNENLKPFVIQIRDYKNFNSNFFQKTLKHKMTYSLGNICETINTVNENNFDDFINKIIENIYNAIEEAAPLIRKTIYLNWNSKPWVNNNILNKMKTRDEAFYIAKRSRCKNDVNYYEQLRNELVNEIRISKKLFYEKKIDSNKKNSRLMWSEIKKLMGDKKAKSVMPDNIKVKNEIISNKTDIADKFNTYFVDSIRKIIKECNDIKEGISASKNIDASSTNIVNILNNRTSIVNDVNNSMSSNVNIINDRVESNVNIVNENLIDSDVNILNLNDDCNLAGLDKFDVVSYAEVNSIICNLDDNKGSKNKINVGIIKIMWKSEYKIILSVLNLSLKLGVIPNSWKLSTIIPLQKIKNINNIEDFRPINTLPIFEQVLEQVVKTRLEKYINENDILDDEQFGFRKCFSCETAIQSSLADWCKSLDNGMYIRVVFIDFARAFETINRLKLIKKLV